MNKPSRNDINKLAMSEPVVHACLMFFIRNDLTYEESLIMMVATLVDINHDLFEKLETVLKTLVHPIDFKVKR